MTTSPMRLPPSRCNLRRQRPCPPPTHLLPQLHLFLHPRALLRRKGLGQALIRLGAGGQAAGQAG